MGGGLGLRLWAEAWEQGCGWRSGIVAMGGDLGTRLWVDALE